MPVSLPDAWVFGSGESGPALALGSKGLCAAWHQARAGGGSEVVVSWSDTGVQWSKPVPLADKSGVWHGYVSLASAPDGSIYAVWLDGRDKPTNSMDIYLARSTDGGKSFGKNMRVARCASIACRPAIAITPDGAIHVAWRGVDESNQRDVYLATSRDSGESFSASTALASDGWKVADSPRSGPALAASAEGLHVSWYSEGKGGKDAGIRWTVSADSAKTFAPVTLVSQGILDANHPTLSVNATGRVHLTFQGRPNGGDGWKPLRAYVAEVTSWVLATRGAQAAPGIYEGVDYPIGQFDATGRLWMFWTSGEAILLSRAREIGTSATL
ncbi:MAG: sialidase family protein [Armatimonas sp.]